ncbi:1-acyl-sn-glycerol-3-phosphate acyltransferase [Rhodobacteraceae bacterium NNCM2]|nr:1-acyl-sn-glycerol-3-phosphate acyltransferase [Coraliihabitans acroporae]
MTWNEADPVALSSAPLWNRVIGIVRLTLAVLVTVGCATVFLIGRGLRRLLGPIIVFHFGAARLWARTCVRLIGCKHIVRGTPVASGALVANHCSWSDILVLRAVRLLYFVSKSDVASWPGVGFLARVSGTVFIERRRVEAKRQEAVLRDRIAANQLLCFFPEGTSTDGLRVLPFKSSLFSAFFGEDVTSDLLVQPVSIRYLPAEGSGLPDSFFGWWGTMPFGAHIRTVMERSFGNSVVVTFHDPVRPIDFESRKELADYCHAVVAKGHAEAAEV